MKKPTQNPEIHNTANGILVAYEFRVPPINTDGTFQVSNLGLRHRTMVFEFDTEVYAFNINESKTNLSSHSLIDFEINEKPIDHLSKHITIKFGNTVFETVGNYTLNTYNIKKADLDLQNMNSNNPAISLF